MGTDYKNAMHYIVGQEVLGGYYVINDISQEKNGYSIWVKKDGEVIKWKEVSNVPLIIEYNLNVL